MTRIAILLSTLRAEGGPAIAFDLAAEWRRQGHDVTILVLSGQDMTMAARFADIAVPVHVLGIDRMGPRHWPRIAYAVAKALWRKKCDALISIPAGVHGAIFAGAAIAGVRRRIVHVGGYPWHWQQGFWKFRLLMRLSAPFTSDLVCVTKHVLEGVTHHFGHVARRMHTVPNGIDVEAFAFEEATAALGHRMSILMVARLDAGKDHATLMEALALVRARGIDATLHLAGDGARRAHLEDMATAMGLSSAVRFLGARRDVPDLLKSADVFAFSVRAEEGLGIALVEAMAAGVPVVATDVGACREVLDGGACGRLVPPEDPGAFAEALLAARNDETRRPAARLRVERVYNRRAMATAYGRLCGISQ